MAEGSVTGRKRRRWVPWALVAGFLALQTTAAWAEPVRVRAALHDDFGRVAFSWSSPVSHKSALRNGRLTVRFGRPIEASFGRVARSLGKYIASVTPGDDGQSVVFDLKGDFDAYSYDSGRAVIVEFADKSPSAADKPEAEKPEAEKKAEAKPETATPSDPEAASGASPDLPVVRVRSGRHPDYTRIVFDWPKKVAYSFKQVGGVATVTFERAARIDLGRVRSRRLPYIGGVRSRTGSDSVTVTLSVPATSRVRHFLAGQKVVLDIRRPSGSEKAGPLPPPAAEGEATKAAKAESAPKPSPTAEDTRETPSTAAKPGAKTAKAVSPAAPQVLKPAAEETAAKPAPFGPGQPTKLTPVRSALSSPGSQAAAALSPQGILSPGTPPPLPPTPATVMANASSDDVNAVTLRFDWDEPVGAAVFRRAGFLWVAFDRPTAIDIDQLRQAGGDIIKGIEQMGVPQATVLRMATLAGINPRLRRDGLAWLLDFRKQPIKAVTPIAVKAQPESPVGARLFLPLSEPGAPIGVTDPEVGDNFVIVPVIPLGHGMGLEYIYPQVRFLPTSQGIVILPRNDDIRVRTLRQGIEISSSAELLISEVTAEDEANRRRMKSLTRILSLDRWKLKNINAFRGRKYELLAAISQAKGNQRHAARLDLVRFFFANGFYAEALAILKEVTRARAEIEQVAVELAAGQPFAEVARVHSLDKRSSEQGGELGFIGREAALGLHVPAELFNSLPTNELSNPLPAGRSWHIIRFTEDRPTPYERYRPLIENMLFTERMTAVQAEHFEQLKASTAAALDQAGFRLMLDGARRLDISDLDTSEATLYTFGGDRVTIAAAWRALQRINAQNSLKDSVRALATLERMVLNPSLLRRAARDEGLYTEPEMQRLERRVRDNTLLDAVRNRFAAIDLLTDAEVWEFYDANPNHFYHEEAIEVEELLIRDLTDAVDIKERIAAGTSFAKFADRSVRKSAVNSQAHFHFHPRDKSVYPKLVPAIFGAERSQPMRASVPISTVAMM